MPSVEYLGHVICAEGLCTSDATQHVTELRSSLGLVNYYGKFLPDLATTLSPIAKVEVDVGQQSRKRF